jgi:cobalamin biosynthesis protein CobD/CbiB
VKFNSTRFYSLIAAILFALFVVAPTFAQNEVTPEPTEQATIAPIATVVATPAPVETPIPAPSPIDQSQIPTWAFVLIIVALLAVVSVSMVGIVQAAKGAPPWVQDILLNVAHTGLDSLETYAGTTDTTLDDEGVAELRKKLAELEASLKATNQKVAEHTVQLSAAGTQGQVG